MAFKFKKKKPSDTEQLENENSFNEMHSEDIFGNDNMEISDGTRKINIDEELENIDDDIAKMENIGNIIENESLEELSYEEMPVINDLIQNPEELQDIFENIEPEETTQEFFQETQEIEIQPEVSQIISEEDDIFKEEDINYTEEELAGLSYGKDDKLTNKKKGIFSFLSSLFQSNNDVNPNEQDDYTNSRFKEYLFLLDTKEDDRGVIESIEICDKNLRLDRHITYLSNKRKEYESALSDMACYDNLTDDEAHYFKETTAQYSQLLNDRRILGHQLNDFNHSINKLQSLEKDAINAMPQIEEAENNKRLLKNDIAIIQTEKERTVANKEKLKFAYSIVHKFSFVVCAILLFSIMFLSGISVITNQSMLLPLITLGAVLVILAMIIFMFRRKLSYEIKLNDKKHSKIVTLLNKKTVVYSYYVNFLNFSYAKYKVKNSRALRDNLNDFSNYKYILKRYDNLGKILSQVQENLEIFMKDKDIQISTSLETFTKSTNIANKITHSKELNLKRIKVSERIQEITDEREQYWARLVQLNIADKSRDKVVEKIMRAYMTELERLALEDDEETEQELDSIDDGQKQPA